ncbi:MAG TPA: protein kinase [Candidatus Binataceae bacterium]|nr:protein kinase [Candidatus Binataceae bacterium]
MIAPQTIVGGRYRVVKVLGGGGMKMVYLAEDLRLAARLCALAEMVDSFTSPEAQKQAVAAFQREADMLAQLNNEHIPRVFDRFSEANHHFLVMEYIDGTTLEDELRQYGGKLAPERVVAIAIQVLETLAYLHALEPPVIYRDLKPSNIMITAHGAAKLIDFGIARHFQPLVSATMIGTQGYAPPEQYRGRVETRSDIYALGATMHHAISGRDPAAEPPFSFPPLRKLCPALDSRLTGAIDQALAYDVANRIPDAVEFKRRLLELQTDTFRSVNGATAEPANGPATIGGSSRPQLKLPLGAAPAQAPEENRSDAARPLGPPGPPSANVPVAPTVLSVNGEVRCPACVRSIPADSHFCSYCAIDLRPAHPARPTPNDETVVLSGGHSPSAWPRASTGTSNYPTRRPPFSGERRRSGLKRPVVVIALIFAAGMIAARLIFQAIAENTAPPPYGGVSGEAPAANPHAGTREYSDSGDTYAGAPKLAQLRGALDRNGFSHVKFRIEGDTLVLSGSVPSEYDRATVQFLCFATTGIFSLRDDLTVSGGGTDPDD